MNAGDANDGTASPREHEPLEASGRDTREVGHAGYLCAGCNGYAVTFPTAHGDPAATPLFCISPAVLPLFCISPAVLPEPSTARLQQMAGRCIHGLRSEPLIIDPLFCPPGLSEGDCSGGAAPRAMIFISAPPM